MCVVVIAASYLIWSRFNRPSPDSIAAEKAEANRIAAEKAEADSLEAGNAEADRLVAEKTEADRPPAINNACPYQPRYRRSQHALIFFYTHAVDIYVFIILELKNALASQPVGLPALA